MIEPILALTGNKSKIGRKTLAIFVVGSKYLRRRLKTGGGCVTEGVYGLLQVQVSL